jgi:flagellar biosynthetic protein FlhB
VADTEDRTLPASEQRRLQAREEGQAPLSREVVSLAGLGASGAMLGWGMPALLHGMTGTLQGMMTDMDAGTGTALRTAATALLLLAGPVLAAAAASSAAAVLLQTGGLVHGAALMPDLSRLNPQRGLGRIFSLDSAVETVKSLVKAGVLAWAIWHGMTGVLPGTTAVLALPPGALLERLAAEVRHMLLLVLGCQAVIAAADTGWVRYRFSARMRMSRQDQIDEHKQSEGDPSHKAKLRAIRRARAKRRMMAAVPTATVIITNPTHYAIALAYDRGGNGAPKVVAKGMDEVAARIRALAAEHRVPMVANPPLAWALHKVELDSEVPAEHFKAVAEIIAYVWRLRGQAAGRR